MSSQRPIHPETPLRHCEDAMSFTSPKSGKEYIIRSSLPGDNELILEFFGRLSKKSIRCRFNGMADGRFFGSQILNNRYTHLVVAITEQDEDSEVVGVCDYTIDDETMKMPEVCLAVLDSNQREGLGYQLAKYTASEILKNGHDMFFVLIEGNEASKNLYMKIGDQVGVAEKIKNPETLIIHMQKTK